MHQCDSIPAESQVLISGNSRKRLIPLGRKSTVFLFKSLDLASIFLFDSEVTSAMSLSVS